MIRSVAVRTLHRHGVAMGRPNFVVFLSDDQAYCDLGCMGATDLARQRNFSAAGVDAVTTGTLLDELRRTSRRL
jgi:arylsulfatase A-like enzyme